MLFWRRVARATYSASPLVGEVGAKRREGVFLNITVRVCAPLPNPPPQGGRELTECAAPFPPNTIMPYPRDAFAGDNPSRL